jgi:hypothetical protein
MFIGVAVVLAVRLQTLRGPVVSEVAVSADLALGQRLVQTVTPTLVAVEAVSPTPTRRSVALAVPVS